MGSVVSDHVLFDPFWTDPGMTTQGTLPVLNQNTQKFKIQLEGGQLSIYNPEETDILSLKIYDMQGRRIFSASSLESNKKSFITVPAAVRSGSYYTVVRIKGEKSIAVKAYIFAVIVE